MDEEVDGPSARYARAVAAFGALVHAVSPEQWGDGTPCAGWNVRQLVNHVAGENAWVVPLLEGRTIDDVGSSLDGDLLGDDPSARWDDLAEAAVASAAADGVLDRVVHVSYGDISGYEYLSQVAVDHVVHAWDLARGIGAPEQLDDDLVAFAHGYLEPQIEEWRSAGAFGAKVAVPADAPLQSQLLGLTGRQA